MRPATLDDISRLTALINRAYLVEEFFVRGERTTPDEVRSLLLDRGVFLLHEGPDGDLAGCVFVECRPADAYFGLLAVEPSRQRAGLGRLLVAAAEDYARERGKAHMELRVASPREELPAYYRALGYVEDGTEPFPDEQGRQKQPCHFVRMRKPL